MPKSPDDRATDATPSAIGRSADLKLVELEAALAEETRTSASLREHLETLRRKVDEIASGFERRLADAMARSAAVAARSSDQLSRRGGATDEATRSLTEARTELARVGAERDRLLKRLAQVEGMQTATIGLPDDEPAELVGRAQPLPSIEELMASLGSFEEGGKDAAAGHLHVRAERPADESQEMLAPEIVFPEEYGEPPPAQPTAKPVIARLLVRVDAEPPIKYPLYKDVMTVGRSETADIQITGDFVSRIHARLVATAVGTIIEDVDSKNGIRVNSKPTERYALQHGDVVGLGRLRFTYIETLGQR